MSRRLLLALAALLVAGTAIAREGEEPLQTGATEELIVTANRVEQGAAEVAGYLTLLTRDEIEDSPATTLDELLRRVPGFSLFRRSSSLVAHPTTQGVSLRGIAPSGVSRALVLLDGVPANDAFGGWVYWSRVPLVDVERVEILRGGASNVWGNYALGGVVNISTRPIEARRLAAGVEVGDHDDLEVNLSGSHRSDRFGWLLGASHFQTGGYPVLRRDQRGPIDIEAFSEHWSLHSKVARDLSPRLGVSSRLFYFDEERGNGTPLTNNDTETAGIDIATELVTSGGGALELTLFGRQKTFTSTFSAQEPDRTSERPALDQFAVESSDLGASAQWTDRLGDRHLFSIGTDLRWIDGESNEFFFWDGETFLRQRLAGGEQRLAGVFGQDLWGITDSLQVTLSARIDGWANVDGLRRETERGDGTVLRSDDFPDRDGSALSPKLALLYQATDRLALRGSVYRSFRAPTINELYRPFRVRNDVTAANADLDPERLTGGEVGMDIRPTGLAAHLVLFWNEIDDPIANVTVGEAGVPGPIEPCGFVAAGGSCRQRRNLGSTRIVGLEGRIETELGAAWRLGGAFLYSDGEIVEAPLAENLEGKRIAQVPEHQITLTLDYEHPSRLGAHLEARYLGEQFEDDLNSRVLDEALIVDLSLVKDLGTRLDLVARIQNLLGEVYEAGVDAQGLVTIGAPRQLFIGARYSTSP